MKKILVIGGSYFFGRVFVETLIGSGEFEVTVLNRGRIPFRDNRVNQLVCDRRDRDRLAMVLLPGIWDAVVDFCGYTADDIHIMLDALSGSAVARYIFISTASVYDDQAPETALTEESPLLNRELSETDDYGGYIRNKVAAERVLMKRSAVSEISCTILRPAIIFGKFNYAPRESFFFEKIISGEKIIIPESGSDDVPVRHYSFVSVRDAAVLTAWCSTAPEADRQCFNLAAPEEVSYRMLVESLTEASGKKVRVEEVSGEMISTMDIQLPFPLDRSLLYCGRKISRLSGISYHGFAEEMKETWKYYLIGHGIDPVTLKKNGM